MGDEKCTLIRVLEFEEHVYKTLESSTLIVIVDLCILSN